MTTVLDFQSPPEPTSFSVKIRNKTVDVNTSLAFSYAEPYDTMVEKGVTPWLVPGAYSVLLTRNTLGDPPKHTSSIRARASRAPSASKEASPRVR